MNELDLDSRVLAETLNLYDRSAADLTRQFLGQLRLLD